jgi:hypothetical protein
VHGHFLVGICFWPVPGTLSPRKIPGNEKGREIQSRLSATRIQAPHRFTVMAWRTDAPAAAVVRFGYDARQTEQSRHHNLFD